MNPAHDFRPILTEVIQKQIAILGPQIALGRARVVAGLEVSEDGEVTSFQGDPKAIMKKLVDQYVILSGLIVQNTVEPLIAVVEEAIPVSTEQAKIDQALGGKTL